MEDRSEDKRNRGKTFLYLVLCVIFFLGVYFLFFTEKDRIISAVRRGDVQTIKAMLESGTDPNTIYTPFLGTITKKQYLEKNFSLLILAIRNNNNTYETTKVLLEHGASIANTKSPGSSILYFAFANLDVVKLLVSYNADPLMKDRHGNNLLHVMPWNLAQFPEQLKVAKYYIDAGVDPFSKNNSGQEALARLKEMHAQAHQMLLDYIASKKGTAK